MKKNDKLKTELKTNERKNNNEFVNLYLFIDGKRFELVPHCRTIREKAYFYSMLKKSNLYPCD